LRSYLDGRVFAEVADESIMPSPPGFPSPSGPLVVGLHGWGRDHRDFSAVLRGYPHLLIDLPGFGVSPPPTATWGAADYAACVAAVLDEHAAAASPEAQPPVVIGHSFGGRVAVCLAASRPDLVRALVLCGVPLLRSPRDGKPGVSYRLGRKARQMGLLSERRFEAMRRAKGSADYNAAIGVMRSVLVRVVNESYDAELAAIRCPVALLWGGNDRAVPPSMVEEASRLLSAPTAADVVGGAGHDVHLEAPDRLRAMLDEVIQTSGSVPRC
jgi:pimeloyl-ACP methyl ester carboxylesterase